jgi:acetolactate synthase-1/2/3 large subunit
VALALRGDILDDEVPAELPAASELPVAAADPERVERALALLRNAERPLIVAGGGVLRAGATDALVALAERTGLPVMTTFRRHDAFPNDHPLFIGSLSLGAPSDVVERARNADVMLAIGTRLGETTTFGYTIPGADATLIQIDASPDVVGRTFPATVAMVADAGRAIGSLTDAAAKVDWPDWSARNRADRDAYERATEPPPASGVRDLVDPARVIGELNRQLPADAVLTCDAGNFYGWLSRYYRYRQPGTFLGPTSGAMGYAVPAAVAAALVRENRVPSVAFAGDGGFLMTGSELAVAAQHGLRVTCVVFNNSMYGTIRAHQERHYPGRVAGTRLASPDFVKYAESFGGIGVRVEDDRDIADGVRQVLEHDGIGLLEVAVAENTLSVAQTLEEVRGGR